MVQALLQHMQRLGFHLPPQSEVKTDQEFHNQYKSVPGKTWSSFSFDKYNNTVIIIWYYL